MRKTKKRKVKNCNQISKYFLVLSIVLILVLVLCVLSLVIYQTDTSNYREMQVKEVNYINEVSLIVLSDDFYEFSFYTTKKQGESI